LEFNAETAKEIILHKVAYEREMPISQYTKCLTDILILYICHYSNYDINYGRFTKIKKLYLPFADIVEDILIANYKNITPFFTCSIIFNENMHDFYIFIDDYNLFPCIKRLNPEKMILYEKIHSEPGDFYNSTYYESFFKEIADMYYDKTRIDKDVLELEPE